MIILKKTPIVSQMLWNLMALGMTLSLFRMLLLVSSNGQKLLDSCFVSVRLELSRLLPSP